MIAGLVAAIGTYFVYPDHQVDRAPREPKRRGDPQLTWWFRRVPTWLAYELILLLAERAA